MTANKIARCKIRFDGFDWANVLHVTSPTGTTVILRCNGKWNDMSDELLSLVNSFQYAPVNDYEWGTFVERDLTYALMQEILDLSKVK